MIYVEIDELTPCLKKGDTKEVVNTKVRKIKNRNDLKGFNKKSGWYVNWQSLFSENEIMRYMLIMMKEYRGWLLYIQIKIQTQCIFHGCVPHHKIKKILL